MQSSAKYSKYTQTESIFKCFDLWKITARSELSPIPMQGGWIATCHVASAPRKVDYHTCLAWAESKINSEIPLSRSQGQTSKISPCVVPTALFVYSYYLLTEAVRPRINSTLLSHNSVFIVWLPFFLYEPLTSREHRTHVKISNIYISRSHI